MEKTSTVHAKSRTTYSGMLLYIAMFSPIVSGTSRATGCVSATKAAITASNK